MADIAHRVEQVTHWLEERGVDYKLVEHARTLSAGGRGTSGGVPAEMERDFRNFEVGALPPFGPMLPVPEIVDIMLLYHDRVLCTAGDHRHAVSLDPRELLQMAEPQVADICERIPEARDWRFAELPRP